MNIEQPTINSYLKLLGELRLRGLQTESNECVRFDLLFADIHCDTATHGINCWLKGPNNSHWTQAGIEKLELFRVSARLIELEHNVQ